MPPRFQQGQLASPVTGTPGLDKSAGVVEQQIAQQADAAAASSAQGAMVGLRMAQQDFDQARGAFMYAQNQAKQERRLNEAIQNEQRKLQVQFDRMDEDNNLNATLSDLKKQYAADPAAAVEAFKQNVPTMQADFESKYGADQKRLRMLMPGQRAALNSAVNELEGWAQKTTTNNLNAKLNLLPEQFKAQISNLSGTIDEQLQGFQKAYMATNKIYDSMRESNLDQSQKDIIFTKQLQLSDDAAKQFVDHLVSQTPSGEAGIKHIDQVLGIVKNARQYGYAMYSDSQKELVNELHSARNAHENEVVSGFKDDAVIRVIDAQRLKAQLIDAADDPKQMATIAKQVQNRMQYLDQQVALVSREPDSKIKNAKLTAFKQEQSTFISELGMEQKFQRSFEQIQRSLTTFAQGQIRFQQSQLLFQQGQNRFMESQQNKAAKEQLVVRQDAFNKEWAKINQDHYAAWALPQGEKQQAAMRDVAQRAIPLLNKAVSDGTIGVKEHGSFLNSLAENIDKVSPVGKSKGFFGFGAGNPVPLKGDEAKKAQAEGRAQFGSMVLREQANFGAMQDAFEQLKATTTNKAERAVLTTYASANLPLLLKSDAYQKMSPQEQAKMRARAINNMIGQYRAGTLK